MGNLSNMGEKIKQLRKQNHLTQKELGDLLNVTDKAVSKWECGQGYPDITIFPLLAKYLQVDTNFFFEDFTGDIPDMFVEEKRVVGIPQVKKIPSKIKRFISIVLFIFLVIVIFYYNDKRIFGAYSFGFMKEYSFNFIPFYKLGETVSLLSSLLFGKIMICVILGLLLRSILFIENRKTVLQLGANNKHVRRILY